MAYPFSISLGLEWNIWKKGRKGKRVTYDGERHLTLFGPNGSGKGACLEIPNLLRLGDGGKGGAPLSIINIDPKGQNAAVTKRWRSTVSEIALLNPFNLLGLGSVGFNPLIGVRSYEDAEAIAEALIQITGNDTHWGESGRGLLLALILFEVRLAREVGRVPLLENVRAMLTGDLAATAKDMVASGDFQLASLAGRFLNPTRETASIVSTADTQTRWLLSEPMRKSVSENGLDFTRLKERPVTVYVILPAEHLQTFSGWLRLVVVCALNALYRRTGKGLRTLLMLSEFAQLGQLKPIMAALGQGRGYRVQLWPVLQDINQLRTIYGRDAANTFLGMSGATFAFCPNDGETAEFMSRRSGEVVEPGLSASDDPRGGGARESWRADRRRLLPPDDLYDIPEFHGLVWFAGQSQPQPVYAPPYWDPRDNPDLVGRYDPDPYRASSGGGAARRVVRQAGKATGVAALLAALAIAGAWLLGA